MSLDVDAEPHLLIFGDGQSGKSAVLRAYAREIMRTRSPQEAQLVVVDYRRSMLGEVPEDYLLNYLTSSTQAQPALRDLASYLESRIPGPDVTPDQLRNRSWWQGAEVFVLVDDYDLVATQQSSPVQALTPLLAQARDVGLHVAVARRSGGASRALYEPVIQSLRDLAMPGLLLSGSPDEGPLLGNQKPLPAPPGRGRLVTRDRGVEVVQMAWSEPTPLNARSDVGVLARALDLGAGQVGEVVGDLERTAVAGVGDPPAVRRTHVAVGVERRALEHELEGRDDHLVLEVPPGGGGVARRRRSRGGGPGAWSGALAEVLLHVGHQRVAVGEDQTVVVAGRLGHEAVGELVPLLGVQGAEVAVLQLADRGDVVHKTRTYSSFGREDSSWPRVPRKV